MLCAASCYLGYLLGSCYNSTGSLLSVHSSLWHSVALHQLLLVAASIPEEPGEETDGGCCPFHKGLNFTARVALSALVEAFPGGHFNPWAAQGGPGEAQLPHLLPSTPAMEAPV